MTTSRNLSVMADYATAAGIMVPITAADVLPLYKAFAAHVAGAFAEEATKQAQVVAAPWEDVGAISIAVGKDG